MSKEEKARAVFTGKKQHGRPFQPGQSGNPNGRPRGARQKLDKMFVEALFADFKEGGVDAIRACRTDKPDVYLNVISRVIPKQVEIDASESVADLASGLHAVADFLGSFAAEESGAHHAGSLPSRPILSAGVRPKAH